jgi:hypothetical protein
MKTGAILLISFNNTCQKGLVLFTHRNPLVADHNTVFAHTLQVMQGHNMGIMNPDEVFIINLFHNGFHRLMHDQFSGFGVDDDVILQCVDPRDLIQIQLHILIVGSYEDERFFDRRGGFLQQLLVTREVVTFVGGLQEPFK